MALLTAAANNAKTAKDGKNILGAIQHLPPYTKSGANFCAFAHKANDKEAREFLEDGGNIAVVFAVKKGDPLPATFWGFPVHDADKSDWRFQDAPGGTVQGVRSKGKAKKKMKSARTSRNFDDRDNGSSDGKEFDAPLEDWQFDAPFEECENRKRI